MPANLHAAAILLMDRILGRPFLEMHSDHSTSPRVGIQDLLAEFEGAFGRRPVLAVNAPGRVNLIGDHTDYNNGFVLPATIDRSAFAVLAPRQDGLVRLRSFVFDETVEYPLDSRTDVKAGSWKSYVMGVVEELRLRGMLSVGFDLLVAGDVPLGAGLSSSAALEVAVVFGLGTLFDLDLDPVDAVRLCQTVEHRYAGVRCGIMDQFCSLLGRAGHALFLDCRSLDYEHVPLPLAETGLAVVIVDSRMSRKLAGSKYGERRRECEAAVAVLRERNPSVSALRDASADMLEASADLLDGTVAKRALHVVDENARTLRGCEALRAGAFESFGELMNASHVSLRDLFEVSAPELDLLVSEAQACDGVLGARMTGGGFGGCTVNLVRRDAVERLRSRLEDAYRAEFGRMPDVYVLEENHETGVLFDERH